ncbi:CDP-glucose 4,6-dehydratase [Rhodophyticola porphyridii]|uniref:CDP-glucose 4,6-dehydratase n=1 Tax=Rhodophyticola porphyridii TaxID=1852017 RepID=A0A3L9Y2X6_9RHOB|nr:CDP-glucose 4,6-dehydratase [Rhodophyticola porphyridii]RMA40663.1 CDP-glucose 4,6-dehydratase [Rhodophyticola porphyridii]
MFDWAGKRILVTGHTGFKGAWLSEVLLRRGAEVFGLALEPETQPSLFDQLNLAARLNHRIGDIRHLDTVRERVAQAKPQMVFHLAAQSLVRRSYRDPLGTWGSNVMGTVCLLEALRDVEGPCACVVVTTDKVYRNREWEFPYRETDALGGHDPYSASKAAAELVAGSFRNSFFAAGAKVRLATARAGNVIGGGDWAEDRLLPDLARAYAKGETLSVRNPDATRPWQHVLDPLAGYMILAEHLWATPVPAEHAFNFGPEQDAQRSVEQVVSAATQTWPGTYVTLSEENPVHEAGKLSLGIERSRHVLGWKPRWGFERAIAEAVDWYRQVASGADTCTVTEAQIAAFEASR